jgi:hypothetical protein
MLNKKESSANQANKMGDSNTLGKDGSIQLF